MDLKLTGKRALVTGGSCGIGRAIAMELAREGASVAICSRDRAQIDAAASEIAAETGANVVGFVADMGDGDAIKRLVRDAAAALGGLDILVNNAARVGSATGAPDTLLADAEALLEEDLRTKVLGYVRCADEAVPHMLTAGWGRIVNVSGMRDPGLVGLSTGIRTGSVDAATRHLAAELGPRGITVNAVAPGAVPSGAQLNALRSPVTEEEVGGVVAFLCSPLSQAVTGEVLSVSGGASRAIAY